MNQKLLPCPFCGGEAYYTESVNGSGMIYAGCTVCGVFYGATKEYSPQGVTLSKDIVSAWNQREKHE